MKLLLAALALVSGLHSAAAAESWADIVAKARGQTVYWNAWGGKEEINAYMAWAGDRVQADYGVTVVHTKLDEHLRCRSADSCRKSRRPRPAGLGGSAVGQRRELRDHADQWPAVRSVGRPAAKRRAGRRTSLPTSATSALRSTAWKRLTAYSRSISRTTARDSGSAAQRQRSPHLEQQSPRAIYLSEPPELHRRHLPEAGTLRSAA